MVDLRKNPIPGNPESLSVIHLRFAHEDQRTHQALQDVWQYWNPFALISTDVDRYESLAMMTLYELKARPSVDELVDSIQYFLSLENPTGPHPSSESVCLFAGFLSAWVGQ